MNFSLVVNGAGNAFLREFGCACGRCLDRDNRANTSVSIVARDDRGSLLWHALVDAGTGVTESLCNTFPPEEARLDLLLFTHWHPDHSLDLNRLCESSRRTARRRGRPFARIPAWCRAGTGKWLRKSYSYEWHRCLDARGTGEASEPGCILEPVAAGVEGIRITPVSVSHAGADFSPDNFRERLPCSASFVIETPRAMTVLLWDLDGGNDRVVAPATDGQKKTAELLAGADYLFIDCFSWTVEEVQGFNTGHLSFDTVRRYARALRPRETRLVHMSGHEEGEGKPGYGWTDDVWEAEARNIWISETLPGRVSVARTGEQLGI